MALTEITSGTQSASVGTEHTLSTQSAAGVYVLIVDTVNMVAGDTVVLRAKLKTLSSSTSATALTVVYTGVQDDKVKLSMPIPTINQLVVTLEQTAGTSRNFPWSLVIL